MGSVEHGRTFLVRTLRTCYNRRHIARQYRYALLTLDLPKSFLIWSIDILCSLLFRRQNLEGRALERILGRNGIVCRSKLPRAKGVALGSLFGEVALEVPPHEPQKRRRPALAAQVGAHDEVEEVARGKEVYFGYLGRVLGEDEYEVDGVGARYGSCHDLLDGARLLLVLRGALEDRLQPGRVL